MKSISVLQNRYDNSQLSPKQISSWTKLNQLVRKYQQEGVLHQLISGSEALERYSDDLELLSSSQYGTDIWLSSSGYQLTVDKAIDFKKAGLMGVTLSLNHYEPDIHNDLQRYKHAYGWVLKAAASIRKANLLLGLRLCPDPDFITKTKLFTYTRLAHTLGASFIHITEPASHQHYGNSSVPLDPEKQLLLDEFAETINFGSEFNKWPVINLAMATNQKISFFSKENPALYVDSTGRLQNC